MCWERWGAAWRKEAENFSENTIRGAEEEESVFSTMWTHKQKAEICDVAAQATYNRCSKDD